MEPKKIKAAKREARKFLKNTRNLNYSKTDYGGDAQFYALDYLESAKNQIKYRFHRSQEKGLNIALGMVTHAIRSDGTDRGAYIGNIESITSTDLRKAAAKYLSKAGYVFVSIIPKKNKK